MPITRAIPATALPGGAMIAARAGPAPNAVEHRPHDGPMIAAAPARPARTGHRATAPADHAPAETDHAEVPETSGKAHVAIAATAPHRLAKHHARPRRR